MTTKETKNTTNTNETTENEKNTVKRTNKKTVGLIVGATVTVAAVIISMLCLTSCKDNKPTATADEVIGTSVQTVTQVVTDSQGNTHIEEETKVVEVKQTKPSEKSENETSAAKNDDKSNNGNSNQSSNNSNSDAGINKQTNLNNTSNNSQSNKTNNSSNSSNSSSAGQTSKPSSGSSSSSSSSQSKPSSGSGSSSNKPSSSSQTEVSDPHAGKTWHEAEYKTEKVWVVDEEACTWQRPIIESHRASICNTCGEEITGHTSEHMFAHMDKGENGSYRIETVDEIVGYETVEEPEVGHWETKTELVREAGWY
ncbi:hypothetical protein [Ruminococcus sp.]|jgi:hypothetical protein|uniref:hypothetical protein n=1 Tax=Ruminococcus sp. TaxID=41978 RepID=UPI002671A40F|nr:hypothetical protein [uncultured Ruminococcus sp.]